MSGEKYMGRRRFYIPEDELRRDYRSEYEEGLVIGDREDEVVLIEEQD